ncbi:MAG: protease modulator HflC [Candidatus Eremiobacteraeota bacterium]|nr:protease modulator HflC [Candidatus Eremiobacteraeota bacterium]
MKASSALFLIVAGLAILCMMACFFVVDQTQDAVRTQFGQPVGGTIMKPGLYFKVPLIQEIHYFDKRIMEWDGNPNEIPTRDKKFIWVDTTARWRIKDPLKFLQTVKDENGAHSRLDDVIDAASRDHITKNSLIDVVRNTNRKLQFSEGMEDLNRENEEDFQKSDIGRSQITASILETARKLTPEYGIELIDVKITRINYVESVQKKVYMRMISERNRIAEKYRSEGEGEKARILGQLEREKKRIDSEAYRKSQEIMGGAEAESTKIYASAYNADPEFYAFLKTMETYEKTISSGTTLFLSSEGELLQLLDSSRITR